MHRPRRGVAIEIAEPQGDKGRREQQPQGQEPPPAPVRVERELAPERVARRHHADPWNKRVERIEARGLRQLDQPRLMQKRPDPTRRVEVRRVDAVEQVVARNHGEANRADRYPRQPDEAREHDHRRADHPDHLRGEVVEPKVERPAEPHDGELEHHQPEAPRDEKPAELRRTSTPLSVEIGGDAGKQNEDWRAEVGDPPCEEESRIGDVTRVHPARAEEVARVIQRHDHHDKATQQVDGIKARAGVGYAGRGQGRRQVGHGRRWTLQLNVHGVLLFVIVVTT